MIEALPDVADMGVVLVKNSAPLSEITVAAAACGASTWALSGMKSELLAARLQLPLDADVASAMARGVEDNPRNSSSKVSFTGTQAAMNAIGSGASTGTTTIQ